ncbi:MAG: TraR/DksA family transcriptional regulator [Candidatus Scalindua sp.]|jgi:RNA polymerase-binding protein DksA
MGKKLLKELKTRLQTRRDYLLKEINLRLKEIKDSGGYRLTDTADIASNIIGDDLVISVAQGEAKEIEQIDNALRNLKSGKYGICEKCGKKINKERLRAIPFVNLCIKCKEAEELEDEYDDIHTRQKNKIIKGINPNDN